MRKKYSFFSLILIAIVTASCKSEDKKTMDFKTITDNYFKEKNALNPLDATQNGQSEFNDKLIFEMTDSYRHHRKEIYDNVLEDLKSVDYNTLSEEEKNSFDIIKWEADIELDLLKQNANLIPIHQFWGTHLTMGQFASAESAQPFKTEKDYTDFLKRMDLYSVWIDSAIVYMKKGISEKVVLPKVLAEKVVPQFEALITSKLEDNLFYSSIKKFPTKFSAAQKSDL